MKVPERSMYIMVMAVLMCAAFTAHSQTLPSKAQILAKMKLANDYFITNSKHDPCASCLAGGRPSNLWTRAVYYEGNLAYYAVSKDTSALNHAIKWGTFHSWNLRNGVPDTNANNLCAGQPYIDLYRLDPTKSERIANIKACIDTEVNASSNKYWYWIDALQMAMPAFAKLGKQYNSTGYFNKMYSLYNYPKTTLGLYNTTDHLWWRDATFKTAKSPAGKNVYWSRGNGWIFAALARVLTELPATETHRQEYETTFTEMAAALKAVQRADGFWNENLADPAHFGGPELTGTGLFTYGIAWGVNQGLLVKADYMSIIVNAWKAIADTAIFSNGALGYVQGTGAKPGDNDGVNGVTPSRNMVPDFDDFGLGCVLLAGSEVAKLSESAVVESMPGVRVAQSRAVPSVRFSRGWLTIANNEPVSMTVSIFDAMGRAILRKEAGGPEIARLPLRLGAGIHVVQIETEGKLSVVQRIAMAR